jgi:hypothetical protein
MRHLPSFDPSPGLARSRQTPRLAASVASIFSGSITSFTTAFTALRFRFWHFGIPAAVAALESDDAQRLSSADPFRRASPAYTRG